MKLTVFKELVVGFIFVNILILGICYYSLANLANMNETMSVLYDRHLKGIEYIKTAQVDLYSIIRNRNNILLSSEDPQEVENYIKSTKESLSQFEESILKFEKTIVDEEVRQLFDRLTSSWKDFKSQEEIILELASAGDFQGANAQRISSRTIASDMESLIEKMLELKVKQSEEANINSAKIYERTRNITIMISIFSIVVSVLTSFVLTKQISTPLVKISEAATKIAEGDLSVENVYVKNKDEIGDVANAFNKMAENLKDIIRKVSEVSKHIASSSEELSASCEEFSTSAEEVAKTINQLATGANAQAKEASNTSEGANEIVSKIGMVAERASAVHKVSIKVAEDTDSGLLEANTAVNKMEQIKKVTEETTARVKMLGEESNKIGDIVAVIRGIADQTNLLALNAAIEAVRAGEQGKGFAVVADEVRKLAEQSASSAVQIGELVKKVQSETMEVVNIMNVTNQEVVDGVASVNKTGDYFKLIAEEIKGVTNKIQEVSDASQEIAKQSAIINDAVRNIAAIAEETAASTEEVSASTEEQTATMEEIAGSAEELAKLAEELQTYVSKFKL